MVDCRRASRASQCVFLAVTRSRLYQMADALWRHFYLLFFFSLCRTCAEPSWKVSQLFSKIDDLYAGVLMMAIQE